MPRTITVTFDDGSSHVYNNAPDDITPDQITERAAKDFVGKTVSNLDGGKKSGRVANPVDDGHSAEEYEAPLKNADGYAYTPAARKMLKLEHESAKDGGGLAKGIGETALSAASGLASSAAGGILGGARALYSLASGEGVDKAVDKGAETIGKIQEMGTYQPRGAAGKLFTEMGKELLSVPGHAGKVAGGAVGEAMGGDQGRLIGESLGEVAPAIIPAAVGLKGSLQAMGRPAVINSRGARKLQEAMKDMTPEEIQQARELVSKSNEEGIPLTGPEAFKIAPKLHELMTEVDKSNNIVSRFVKDRPEQAKQAIAAKLAEVGDDIGLHEAANKAQVAADEVITNAQKFRTEAASPDYKAQRASDADTLGLIRDLKDRQKDIKDGTAWKNDAIQQAGRWYQFSHEMGMKANEVAAKTQEWASSADDAVKTFEAEGGRLDPNVAKTENYLDRASEGKAATQDAVKIARERQDYIDGWQKEVNVKADQLAEKNLPFIQSKLRGFMNSLDEKIRLAHPDTTEGQILRQFKEDLAPGGEPLMLPSQLESVYKTNRDKLQLNLQPTPLERTTAGVLKGDVKALDALIQEVSPAIKQGREIYAQLSKEFVDPLMKSPVGRLAGKGAEAQKEAVVSRMTSELQNEAATPDRIRMLADNLTTVDATAFPDMVRAHLEAKFNKAAVEKIGQTDRLTGAKFAEGIASTPKDRANIAAMIEKSAEAQGKTKLEARAAARGFSNMLEVLQATGRITKLGVQGIEEGSLIEKAALAAPHIKSYGAAKAVSTSIREVINRGAYKNLANVFTDVASIDKMVELSNIKATNQAARSKLVAELIDSAVAPAAVGDALDQDDKK